MTGTAVKIFGKTGMFSLVMEQRSSIFKKKDSGKKDDFSEKTVWQIVDSQKNMKYCMDEK